MKERTYTMKVFTTFNSKKPENRSSVDCDVIMIIESNDRKFALHKSYNPLFSCYMLTDYATGVNFTAFGIPKTDIKPEDIDRCVDRCKDFLSTLDEAKIKGLTNNLPVVNSDDPEISTSPSYEDVELARKNAKSKEKIVKRKVSKKKSPVQSNDKPKKKRGRPRKKEVNTLF